MFLHKGSLPKEKINLTIETVREYFDSEYQPCGKGALALRPPEQLLLNKFFDLIIPSLRTSKIKNCRQMAPKWPTGLKRGVPLEFWALLSTFAK